MHTKIFLAMAAFVIIFAGGVLLALVKRLPFDKGAKRVVEALVAVATLAALVYFIVVPLVRGM